VDAQAIQIGEPTVSGVSRRFAVPWRWSLVLFVALIAVMGVNAAIFSRELRVERLGCVAVRLGVAARP